MPRQHAPWCTIDPAQRGHGLFCVSRPVARAAVANDEPGKAVPITVDIAVSWSNLAAPLLVRMVSGTSVVLMASGTARQLAAVLLVAAGQAEEVLRDVTRQRSW
ncbi:MAG TPA: hypothetical protein VJ851_06035 [Jatrophihabitans sp.]|nr:hypothetical protein [Jatrophihabitans sp.]